MPVFSIETPGGRVLDIEAADEATALRGAQEWHAANSGLQGAAGHLAAAVTDIPAEIKTAATDAATAINTGLNPFSDENQARTQRAAQKPFWDFSEEFGRFADVGRGIMGLPSLASAPLTGAARSLIGHPLAATGLFTYDEAKGKADTAMMGLGARTGVAPAKIPTAKQLKAEAKAAYQSPEVKGLQIDPYSADLLASKIETDLTAKGFRPTPKNAGETFAEVGRMKPKPGTAATSVDDIDSVRQALNITARERNTVGKPTPDATAAQAAIREIDDYLTSLRPTDIIAGDAVAANKKLTEARGNYAAGARAEEIDFRLNKAERQAAKSGSGMNIENARRQKIDQVSDYGLTPAEIALKDQIVLGTKPRNALRTAGKLGVDGGLSLTLSALAAMGTGGWSVPLTIAGTGARLAGQALTKSQIKQLNQMIRARSPLAQSLPPVPIAPPSGLLGATYPGLLPQPLGLMAPMSAIQERR